MHDQRVHCRDVHGNTSEKLRLVVFAAVLVRNNDSDLAAEVDVPGEFFAFDHFVIGNRDFLADCSGVIDQFLGNGHCVDWQLHQGINAGDVFFHPEFCDPVGEFDEVFILGNKVCFATDAIIRPLVPASLTIMTTTPSLTSRSARLAATF